MDKRGERSAAFFEKKKNGQYRKSNAKNCENEKFCQIISEQKYRINFVFSDFSLVLANQIKEPFPSTLDFFRKIKQKYVHSNIILFTPNKTDLILAKQFLPLIDLFIKLDENVAIVQEERPILFLRKYLFKEKKTFLLMGPNILITKGMNTNNNKQYDIVKDIRRFYIFKYNSLIDINYQELLSDLETLINVLFQ